MIYTNLMQTLIIVLDACPQALGDEPTKLTMEQGHMSNAFLDFKFRCRGHVTAWRYFRVKYTDRSAFVTTWRKIHGATDRYKIISKTELPPSPLGAQTVTPNQPIPVERDDFIAVHFTGQGTSGFLPICPRSDPACLSGTTYSVFQFGIYDEELHVRFSMEIDAPTSSRGVALQAIVVY